MLKGHVFKKQRFGNEIFALFIDTFLNKKCGIAENYKEKMEVTATGSTLTVSSGCVCVRASILPNNFAGIGFFIDIFDQHSPFGKFTQAL